MANLNKLFLEFNNKIKLTSGKSNLLRQGRDALRKDIRNWFADNQKNNPKFYGQGSFSMHTTINPLSNDEYDLDDGIYLQGYSNDKTEWPSTSTVHSWIKTATENRTSKPTIDKNACVRINYESDYHIDLPIYIMQDGVPQLAHKSEGWTPSDPKEFTEWFIKKVGETDEQLRRIVRYLKAWKDYRGIDIKSIELTILASNYFDYFENRDDKALYSTVKQILTSLKDSFVCIKPSNPYNNLFDSVSITRKNHILESLEKLKNDLEQAIEMIDEKEASKIIIKQFGTRFPIGNDTKNYQSTTAPGVLYHDGRSGQ